MPEREKLIDLLDEVHRKPLGKEYRERLGTIADYLIANGVTIQKWIPVSEPPKESGDYLVCTRHDFYKTIKMAKATFKKCSGGFYGQGGHWSNVTHWMPLPETPKEVE